MPHSLSVPCCFMRGGTSKGPFFNQADLPPAGPERDRLLLAIMGSPDARQIDGLGGGHALTSKVGMVALGDRAKTGIDLHFLFAQLQPNSDRVDTTPNCGNMLAAVVPFALETGLIQAQGDTTTVRVLTENTGMLSDITVHTPGGRISYEGDTRIDGVPGSSAAIEISFLDTAGSVCGSLLPTGQAIDVFEVAGLGQVEATCIDNGMPMVLVRAADFGCDGQETVAELNADEVLKARLEALRLVAAAKMGLGDVGPKNFPKMCLLSAPKAGGALSTRCFIPHVCHEAIGVLAAVTVATACVLPQSIAAGLSQHAPAEDGRAALSIEHPSGEFSVVLQLASDEAGGPKVVGAALLRTARLIMQGSVRVLASRLAAKN
ncbi:MAG: 4-oxalomesaconate tautomerase [Neisseriaceae bacterium]|nr:4-oxalomesaconate tautomerase [Neisseriaceae bacterium]